eukprot:scpid108778/ scgid10686/ 
MDITRPPVEKITAQFPDSLSLRYGWHPHCLPSQCVCGAAFAVSHGFSCPTGGFPSIQHNEVRDITASVLKRVCPNVSIESHLQPITGELFNHRTAIKDEQAHLDVAADGVWDGCLERTFVDVRVFNPYASTNRSTP